jgi:hypothetical protein
MEKDTLFSRHRPATVMDTLLKLTTKSPGNACATAAWQQQPHNEGGRRGRLSAGRGRMPATLDRVTDSKTTRWPTYPGAVRVGWQ